MHQFSFVNKIIKTSLNFDIQFWLNNRYSKRLCWIRNSTRHIKKWKQYGVGMRDPQILQLCVSILNYRRYLKARVLLRPLDSPHHTPMLGTTPHAMCWPVVLKQPMNQERHENEILYPQDHKSHLLCASTCLPMSYKNNSNTAKVNTQ